MFVSTYVLKYFSNKYPQWQEAGAAVVTKMWVCNSLGKSKFFGT